MKTALSALLLLSLTACQAFLPGTGAGNEGSAAADAGTGGLPDAVSGQDADGEEQAKRARQVPPPKPPAVPARGELSEQRLTGLTTNQTWDLLGPPTDVEQVSPATVWTYQVAGCRLELFFYFDLESQEQRTLALDLQSGSDFVGSRPFCWYTLAQRGRSRGVSGPQAGPAVGAAARAPSKSKSDGGSDPEDAVSARGADAGLPGNDPSAQGGSAQ